MVEPPPPPGVVGVAGWVKEVEVVEESGGWLDIELVPAILEPVMRKGVVRERENEATWEIGDLGGGCS